MRLKDILNDSSFLVGKKGSDVVTLECDLCPKLFEKSVDLIKRNARRNKGGKSYCSKECRDKSFTTDTNVVCGNCGIGFKRKPSLIKKRATDKIFCSRKCRAVGMNWNVLAKLRHCKGCNNTFRQPPNSGRTNKYCLSCSESIPRTRIGEAPIKLLTIQQFADRIGHDKKSKRVRGDIAGMCRGWNRHLVGTPCQVCGYDKIVEFCHIKPVKDFSEHDTIGSINDESNIFMLCPTHHAELDRGILKAEDVPARKLLTNEVEIEYNI